MTCLSASEIARVATAGDSDPHLEDCITCRRSLDADRALRSRLLALPIDELSQAKRRELAAELVATGMHRPRRVPRWYALAAGAAAAVMVASVLAWARVAAPPRAAATVTLDEPVMEQAVATRARYAATEDAASALPPAVIASDTGARFTQRFGREREQVALEDGTIVVDSRASRAVDIRVGDATVICDNAKVAVRARHSAIVSIQPVFGAAAMVSHGNRVVVESATLILQDEPPAVRPPSRSLVSFRQAWVSLREGHNREAVALFDAETEPAVAEEALYWSAIACKRAADEPAARERLRRFAQRFPDSPYTGQVRAMLGER